MPTLFLRKPKNHNCSNFQTYLQYQGFNFLRVFFFGPVAIFFLCFLFVFKALSAGMTQLEESSIFGKGVTSGFSKFMP